MDKVNTSATKSLFYLLIYFVIFIGIYYPGFKTPYLMDDSHTIQSNQFVHSLKYFGFAWTSSKAYSSSPENYGYRPVITNFNQIAWFLGNGSPLAFQIAKKILLFAIAILLFLTWKTLTIANSVSASAKVKEWWQLPFLGLGLFLFHPINTQVANYIAASSSLVCGLFYILSFFLYLKYLTGKNNFYLVFALISFFLSIMSKEEGVTLIAVLFVFHFFFDPNQGLKKNWRALLLYLVTAFLAVAMIYSHFEKSSDIARGYVPSSLYFVTQWSSYLHYFSLYFWPLNLNFDNLDFPFATQIWSFWSLAALSLNIVIAAIGFYMCRKKNLLGLGILGFYISISPSSSVVSLAEAVNDHRPFIPFFFFGLAMIEILSLVSWPKASRPWILASVVGVLAILTFQRNLDYRTGKDIWIDTNLKNPKSPRAKNNLALYYMSIADYNFSSLLLERCIDEAPAYATCFINLGVVRAALGDPLRADQYFQKAVELDHGYLSSRIFYAQFLIKQGRLPQAQKLLKEADQFASGLNLQIHNELQRVNHLLGEN